MENTTDLDGEDPYSPDEWAEIFEALKVPMSEENKKRLRKAAGGYRIFAEAEPELPTRKAERDGLMALYEHATAIAEHAAAIDALPISPKLAFKRVAVRLFDAPMMKRLTDLRLADLIDDYKKLAAEAKKDADAIPTRGPTPKKARYYFVLELAEFYREVIGDPGLSYDQKQALHSGPFYKFVVAALSPLNPHASQGVASDIKAALRGLKTPSD